MRTRPRQFQAYCVGAPKSGTHSLAALFRCRYRSAHEPEAEALLDALSDRPAAGAGERRRWLRERDLRLGLEMESSQLLAPWVEDLAAIFPRARFVLTIRDCYTWLDSMLDHQSTWPASPAWRRYRDLRFGPTGRHHPAEAVLAEHGLYRLDGYLSWWNRHNRSVLRSVPGERLLVLRTADLSAQLETLARFVGVPPESLDRDAVHAFPARRRHRILARIDPDFVDERVRLHCADLMQRYFPDLGSVTDTPVAGRTATSRAATENRT